ncbi:hypothetical protein [Dolichospermum phage Dfl-JY45]
MATEQNELDAGAGALGLVRSHRVGLSLIAGVLAMMTVMGLLAVAGVPVGIASGRSVVALMSLVAWGTAACGGVFWALGWGPGRALRDQKVEILSLAVLLAFAALATWLASLD